MLARDLFVDQPGLEWVNLTSAFLVVGLIVAIAIHAGLLAAAVALCATNLISAMPWTLDSGAWYFPQSALVLGALALLAAFGGYAMLSRRSRRAAARGVMTSGFSRPRRRTCSLIGDPSNPYSCRSWFTRKRSYEKWNDVAMFVKSTNVGGATLVCAA